MTNDWGNLVGTAFGLAIVGEVLDKGVLNRKRKKAKKGMVGFYNDKGWV